MDEQTLNNFVFPRNPSFLPNYWLDRQKLAEQPNCPVYLLEKLVDDESENVRRYRVAENPNCPVHLLEKFVNYEWEVYRLVAANPNCPQYLKDYIKTKNFIRYYGNKF